MFCNFNYYLRPEDLFSDLKYKNIRTKNKKPIKHPVAVSVRKIVKRNIQKHKEFVVILVDFD